MSNGTGAASGRARSLLTGVMFTLLAVLMTSYPTAETPATATLAALALVFAAVCLRGSRCVVLAVGAVGSARPARHQAPPVLPGRATDPVHHPLRPRAPGPV